MPKARSPAGLCFLCRRARRDVERERRGVRHVEALDGAGKIEPRQPIAGRAASIAASLCPRRRAPAPAAPRSSIAARSSGALPSSPTTRKPRSFNAASARARFCTIAIGTNSSAPEADLASTPVASGLWRAVVTIAATAKAAAVRMMAPTLCGSVIWSSTSTMPVVGQILDAGRGQRIGLGEQALMHGVRRQPRRKRPRPHHVRRQRQRDILLGEAPQRVLGDVKLADMARRIGKRRRDRVPAVEDDGIAGSRRGHARGPRPRFAARAFSIARF